VRSELVNLLPFLILHSILINIIVVAHTVQVAIDDGGRWASEEVCLREIGGGRECIIWRVKNIGVFKYLVLVSACDQNLRQIDSKRKRVASGRHLNSFWLNFVPNIGDNGVSFDVIESCAVVPPNHIDTRRCHYTRWQIPLLLPHRANDWPFVFLNAVLFTLVEPLFAIVTAHSVDYLIKLVISDAKARPLLIHICLLCDSILLRIVFPSQFLNFVTF